MVHIWMLSRRHRVEMLRTSVPSWWPLTMMPLLLLAVRGAWAARHEAVEVSWDFNRSADDWAQASPVEMDAEVQWKASGTIRGTVRGPSPLVDSPRFRVLANDRHHVAIRMRSFGAATLGRLELRTGRVPGETDHSLNPWSKRGSPSVVVKESSSGGENATLAADGDLHTTWKASSNSNEWITIDFGVAREVAAIRLQAPTGNGIPRNVRIQRGLSLAGTFTTVTGLTVANSSESQEFAIPPSSSQYWRLYILDTWGASSASLREVAFLGPGDTTNPQPLDFEIINDDAFHVYYVPIHRTFQGVLTQLRLRPGLEVSAFAGRTKRSLPPNRGDAFEIDWIRLTRAPNLKRIRGCIDMSYLSPSTPAVGRAVAVSNLTTRNFLVNGFLELGRTSFGTVENAEYGTTKSCLRGGGEMITLAGAAFGNANAKVYVDGKPCTQVIHTPGSEETEVSCRLPPMPTSQSSSLSPLYVDGGFYEEAASTVEVVNGRMPGLKHGVGYMSYQAAPPPLRRPVLSNLAARSIDVSWEPPSDYWDALAVTGYQVGWRSLDNLKRSLLANNSSSSNDSGSSNSSQEVGQDWLGSGEDEVENVMTVGNVTTTTVRGLFPGLKHAFWVRALSENRSDVAWEQVDLYGRREPLEGAVTGYFSDASDVANTLVEDILFGRFNANATLNHSVEDPSATLGPRGQWAGEGHYGLQLVGTAQVENCNRSMSCCDSYNTSSGSCQVPDEGGSSSKMSCYSYSAATPPGQVRVFDTESTSLAPPLSGPSSVDASQSTVNSNAISRLPSSLPAVVVPHDYAIEAGWGSGIRRTCGPALRLTANRPASAGAAWYPRDVTVGEGFDTTFTFRLSSPSLRCNNMDGVYTHCRSRGADGLAFVVQGEGLTALGSGGMGMGYAGIPNMLAVEFDTFYNPDLLEPYENHVSVQTRGWRDPGSAHDSYSLGSTPNVPDLTDGNIVARVVYTPTVRPEAVFDQAFQATAHVAHFMSNGDFSEGGLPDWGAGIGLLSVYVDNLHEPCLIVPLNLEATLMLHHGRAFVGFTAATGRDTWQVHDVLKWSFSSLREDRPFWPPPVIEGYNSVWAGGTNSSCKVGSLC